MKKRYLHGKYSSGQLCLMAVFIAIGLVLQYIEGTFAIFAPPGAKVGLANVVSIISLFMFGGANAFVIAVIRAVTGSLLGRSRGGCGCNVVLSEKIFPVPRHYRHKYCRCGCT